MGAKHRRPSDRHIYNSHRPPSTSPEFLISIQNISTRDFVVNLGFMFANGKVMFPEAIRLSLTLRRLIF